MQNFCTTVLNMSKLIWYNISETILTPLKDLNHLVHEGRLTKGCLIRLNVYEFRRIREQLILIVTELDVLDELGIHEKIGDPVRLEGSVQEEPDQAIPATGFYGMEPEPKIEPETASRQTPKVESRSEPIKQEPPSQRQFNKPRDSAHGYIHPIDSITPFQGKWTIKARVTNKSEVKHWHNRNGEGKLFSVTLLDDSGEVKATGFNDQCDMFFDLLQEGNVYYISTPAKCSIAKKKYSNVNHDYEIQLEAGTKIEKAESQADVPQIRFHFTTIGNLQSVDKDAVIDVIGILRGIEEVSEIISKTTSKPYSKRDITLVDNTNFSVRLTLWGGVAGSFNAPLESVVAFKSVKVSDFGGKSLSLLSSGTVSINPDVNEAHTLKGWYDAQGKNGQFSSHAQGGAGEGTGRASDLKTIAAVKEENLGMSEKGDYFSIIATIILPGYENFAYPACLSEGCQKKVTNVEDGWRCEKCEKTHPKPEYRYVISIIVSDFTGQMSISCFNDQGVILMGMTADKLMELKENDMEKDAMAKATNQQYIFRCRAKQETYGEQTRYDTSKVLECEIRLLMLGFRVRYQCVSLSPLNYASEATKLMSKIKLYD